MIKILRYYSKSSLSFSSVNNYGFTKDILSYFSYNKIHTSTEIQDLCFKNLQNSKFNNFFIGAQTGSGKTYSYLIPEIDRFKKLENKLGRKISYPNEPNIVVLAPSKELCNQIYTIATEISHYSKLSVNLLDSSKYFKDNLQNASLKNNLIVSNMSIFNSLNKINKLKLSKMQTLIIDEADVFIDCGYSNLIKNYIDIAQSNGARVIFVSATLTSSLNNFFKKSIKENCIKYLLSSKTHVNLSHIEQEFIKSTMDKKEEFMKVMKNVKHGIDKTKGSCIVFCNSIESTNYVYNILKESGLKALPLHGSLNPKIRLYNYKLFKEQNINYLVTTDLGSRGLDFPFVNFVVNFDFPKNTADYLHRIGRTGRNNSKGKSISLYHKKDNKVILNELKEAHQKGTKLKIGNSSYFKINKEDLKDISKLGKTEQETINIIKNTKKRYNLLPKDYVDLENNKLSSKTKVRNWKKEKLDVRIKDNKKITKEIKSLPKNLRGTSKKAKKLKSTRKSNTKSYIKDNKDKR